MTGFLAGLLALSVKGALVAALVALVLAAGGRRLPATLAHGLWLLVFVRLALPVLPESPLAYLSSVPSQGGLLPGLDAELVAGVLAAGGDPVETAAADSLASPWAGAAAAVWLLGFAALLARKLAASLRLRRRLRRARPVADERALRLFEGARRVLAPGRDVELLETRRLQGPAVTGWLQPRIVLPQGLAEALDDDALRHVLLHELAHVRRLDGAVQAVAGLVAAVHWFNPLAWYALHRLEAECETACDAAVLARLPRRRRAGYGRTLIEVAARPRPASDPLGAPILGLSRHHDLKRRILMIARYRPTSLRRALACAIVFAAVAAVTLTEAPVTATPRPAVEPGAAGDAQDRPADDQRSTENLDRVREAGVAMYYWLTDAAADAEGAESDAGNDDASDRADWSRCPAIGHDELRELLVPDHVAELPATDAWGHPLEFCLERNPTPPVEHLKYQVGVRSPGRDGVFEGTSYPVGAFPVRDLDRDVVWIDGYFVTWPSKEAE